jgi:integrase
LRWEWIDLERGVIFLPDSKTGKKSVVLAAPAIAVLSNLIRTGGYVIAGNDPEKPRADLKRPWAVIAKRAGLSGVRIHDLRHSFASVGVAEPGWACQSLESCLVIVKCRRHSAMRTLNLIR